jgi:hypothetical protein
MDLAALVNIFSGEEMDDEIDSEGHVLQAVSFQRRPLLSSLRLKFPNAYQLSREHIMAPAELAPTLRQLSLDTRRASGHLATIRELGSASIAQLVARHTQLRSLHLDVLMPWVAVNALNTIGRLCRGLRCFFVRGAFQLDLLATCTCSRPAAVLPVGNDSRGALTSAFLLVGPPDASTSCADDASNSAAAARAKPPLFPELRSLVLESTQPVGSEGVPLAVMVQAIRSARARGEHEDERVEQQLFASVNSAAAQRILAHLMRQAPRLEGLRMLHDEEVDYFINALWQQMHQGGLATCGPQHDCPHK